MTEPNQPHDAPLDSTTTPAALGTLTSCVLEAARATEALRLATELRDDGLEGLAIDRLRTALVAIDRACAPLARSELAEATALVSHLEIRVRGALEAIPAERRACGSLLQLLGRFGPGRGE